MKTRPPGWLFFTPPATTETILFFYFGLIEQTFPESLVKIRYDDVLVRHVTSVSYIFPYYDPVGLQMHFGGNISIPNTTLIHTFVNSRVSSPDSGELQPERSYEIVLIKNTSVPRSPEWCFIRGNFTGMHSGRCFSPELLFFPPECIPTDSVKRRKRFLIQSEGCLRALNPSRKGTKLQMKRGKHPAFRVIY